MSRIQLMMRIKKKFLFIAVALVFQVSLENLFGVPAGEGGNYVPHEVISQPSYIFVGSTQSPPVAQRGQTVEITWTFEATAGRHREAYYQGESLPNPTDIINWGVPFYGLINAGGTRRFTKTRSYTARGRSTAFWGAEPAWFYDPCDNSRKTSHVQAPSATHNFVLSPAPPNTSNRSDDTSEDLFPGPGPGPLPEPGPKPDPGPEAPPERPDQGEAALTSEVIDPTSFILDSDRGSKPKRSDGYVVINKTDPADLGTVGSNDVNVELTHRIVTINSPAARDLKGTLKLDVEPGSIIGDYVVFHYDSTTGARRTITLPFQMPVTEPGHDGGDVHDFHAGYEQFSFRRIGDGALTLKVTVAPDNGAPFKTSKLHLLPIEMKVVDRDDPKKKWDSERDHNQSKPIYAGESCGDMVSWKLGGTDTWSSTVFTWTAEGPGGEAKTGPTGAGKNEWTINDADDDTATNWLKWKPGKWKIKVQIGSATAEFEQEVGWRTEDYVVIGQIVETHTHDGDAPPLVAVGDNFWEISSPVALYRRAVLYDMLDLPVFDGLPDAARDTLMITPLPITAKLTEAWFGYWYLMPAGLTPKGPCTQAHPSGNGNVQNGHRFWALQHIFNVSPDAPLAPETFTPEGFDTLKTAEQYRVIHRYKSKFVVTSDGKIDSGKVVQIKHIAEGGPTKMNFGIAAGEFSPIWNNPAYTFFSLPKQPSETNQYQGAHKVSADGTKLSYYATGRVGAGGQNVNWRLMGKDAPWIFSEIIVELKPDRTVAAQIKASVDKSWNETTGAVQGETAFNNLNLYKLRRNLQTDEFEFALQKLMPMEGELEPFINSASGQRPEPPIPPSVQ